MFSINMMRSMSSIHFSSELSDLLALKLFVTVRAFPILVIDKNFQYPTP